MKTSAEESTNSILDSFLIQPFVAQHSDCVRNLTQREILLESRGSQKVEVQAIGCAQLEPEVLFRFERDNQKLGSTDRLTLAKPIAYGVRKGVALFVSNVPEGQTLSDIDYSQLSILQQLAVAIDLLEALDAIHATGLVHCNIQPRNMTVANGRATMHGMGLTRYLNPSDQGPETALEFSTYVSPELSGALIHDIGPASDLYSLGAVLFEIFAGRPPFQGVSVNDMLFQHLTNEPPFEVFPDSVPVVIQRVLKSLLQKDPPQRYQQAASVAFDLRGIRKAIVEDTSPNEFVIFRNEIKPDVCDPAFVGRQIELDQLKQEVRRIKTGRTRQTMVSCPSGIGKSRLVLEFMRHASKENVTVLCGRGSNEAGREPMAPLLDVIQQLDERIADEPVCLQRFRTQLEGYEAAIESVCPEFAKTLQFDKVDRIAGPEEFGQNRVENAIAKLLASAAATELPLMIWIDDCQWLDEQTCKILKLISEFNPKNLLLLFSMRSESKETVAEFLEYVNLDRRIELGPLSDEEVGLLQESMTGPLPAIAAKTVVKHAAGSPFMASAVIRGMFEAGAIKHDQTGWKTDKETLTKIQAADDAAQVLLQRLRQLPPETLKLLSIAALIGKEFDVQSVSEICNSANFETHADRARKNRLIWSRANGTYSFVHDKIREALLELLDSEVKQQHHLRIAEYFESHRRNRVFDLAFHFHRANCPEKALPYALESADVALARFSLDVAEDQLKIALAGIDDASQETQYKIYSTYADVTMLDGRYDESESWLEKSVELTNSQLEKSQIVSKRGELAFKRGNKDEAVEYFESALAGLGHRVPKFLLASLAMEVAKQAAHSLLPKRFVGSKEDTVTDEDRLAWKLFSKLAHGYWYTRDKYQTLWSHLKGLNLAERYSPTPELAQAYSEHAPVMSLLPWHSRGIDYANRSLELREGFGDIWGQGQSRNFKSILLYSASEFDECVEQARRAIGVLERTGDYWEVHIARYQLAASLYRQGDLKGAAREAKETYNSALELGDYQATGNIIDVWVRANMYRIPSEVIERETSHTLHDMQGKCQILLAHGVNLVGKSKYDSAIEKFEEAIKLSEKAGVLNTYITPNYAWLATALRLKFGERTLRSSATERKPLKRLIRAAKKAVRVARSFKNELPHSLRELGAAYVLAGRISQSKKYLLESIEVAKSQGAEYEKAQTECLYAQFAQEMGVDDLGLSLEATQQRIHEIESGVSQNSQATKLSILDRFESLLEAGRKISSVCSREEVALVCQEAAKRLLRSQTAILVDDFSATGAFQDTVDMDLVYECTQSGRTTIGKSETLSKSKKHRCEGSYIACPIVSYGKITCVLYAGNDAVNGLFGEEEIKIAEYIATTTGAALEKADSFTELEQVNITLERRVEERTATIHARSKELEATATALRETQSSLETARDVAQHASDAKSEFLARMSHEIRTPIAAILGFTELMLRGELSEDERNEKLETILKSGQHLLRLVNNLLDLSKVEADKMETETLEFNPITLTSEVIQSLASTADEKHLEMDLQIEEKIPRLIQSDPTRFRQILTNLIGNAIKFTDEGSVKVIAFVDESSSGEPALFLDVIDTGIGMTDEQSAKVFAAFTQADTSVTRKFGGTGLGLSISKRLAEELGGGITVSSTLGQGSCFRLELPPGEIDWDDMLTQESATQAKASPKLKKLNQANFDGKRILIVDDAETNREFLRLILRNTGAIISICENGLDAVNTVVREQNIDIVLMDMQMPILDGYNATRQLRKLNIDVPVLALTANSMKNDDAKCMEAGCSDYLSKPVNTSELFAKISLHLDAGNDDASQENSQGDTSPANEQAGLKSKISALASKFTGKLGGRINELDTMIEGSDFTGISEFGHWLKGTAAMVGLFELSESGMRLDEAGTEKSHAKATEALAELQLELQTNH